MKAVTKDELYGFINPASREWRDGLFSSILREQASLTNQSPKWIILDGDIDPEWIESLNTLMDDNKLLTLVSNERIALTAQMRLIFEISHLKCATPATVSRAGVLFLNTQDLGWTPYTTSWIERRLANSTLYQAIIDEGKLSSARVLHAERTYFTCLMDKYVTCSLNAVHDRFPPVVAMTQSCYLKMLCSLLDCLLTAETTTALHQSDNAAQMLELYFVFACVWAFGSALSCETGSNTRSEFSAWWMSEFKSVRFPTAEKATTVFDFFINPDTHQLVAWLDSPLKFEPDPDIPCYASLFPTTQTICIKYFLHMFLTAGLPVLLVGNSGSGKTAIVSEVLDTLPEQFTTSTVPMHYYMTSEMVQCVLEKPLEKKAGKAFAPPGDKRTIFFLDDLNAAHADHYGTVQAHTLIRQHLSYGHWYYFLVDFFYFFF